MKDADAEFIKKFEKEHELVNLRYFIGMALPSYLPPVLGDKYYDPIVKSSFLNFEIYPETLDWIVKTYYNRNNLPTMKGIVVENIVGEQATNIASTVKDFFTGGNKVNQENVKKFEENLTALNRIQIKLVNIIIGNIEKYLENEDIKIFAHAALINYYLHPVTLDYVMKKSYKNTTKPTLIRHYLYTNTPILKIIFLMLIIYSAFYMYKTKNLKKKVKNIIKKIRKRRSIKKLSRKLSKKIKDVGRKIRRSVRKGFFNLTA